MPSPFAAVGAKVTAAFMNSNRPGLVPIIPASVSATSGTVTKDAFGGVLMSTAGGTISMLGVFSSTYDNYLIKYVCKSKSASLNVSLNLQLSGTNTSSGWTGLMAWDDTTHHVQSNGAAGLSGLYLDGVGNSGRSRVDAYLYSPALAEPTGATAVFNLGTGAYVGSSAADHSVAAGYNDMALVVSTGTISGTVRVYGFNS